jgi:hypothetical protein
MRSVLYFTELVLGPPSLLGLIHGDIGILQEHTFICSIMWIYSDAYARCHNKLMGVYEEGLAKTVNNLLCDLDRTSYYLQVRKDQHKLVAAEARNGITLPQRCPQPLCRSFEKEVPCIMTEGVIHVLEIIEVDHCDADIILIPLGLGQGNAHAIGEELSVGKTCQGIMKGHLLDLFL